MTVAVVFTGGTIASRVDPAAGGAVPALRGADILARTPGLADADIEVIDWGLVTASHMGTGQMLAIARLLAETVARPEISGVVVVQGTDTIEETSFAYDLLVPTDKPIVVTGAMRNSSEADYDGPANLRNAVACAARRRVGRSGCGRCAQRFNRGCRSGGQDPRHGVGHVPASRWASAGNGRGWRGRA